MRGRWVCLVAAAIPVMFAASAHADGTPKPWAENVSEAQRSDAIELFQRGNAFFVKRQYPLALEQYERAVDLWDHPAIRGNMAVCKLHMDRPLEAYEDIRAALRFGKGPFEDAIYSHLLSLEKALLGQLARVQIRCEQRGATIFLDGDQLFNAPGKAERIVRAGKHQLVATKPNYLTNSKPLTLLPGKTVVIEIKLKSLAAAGRYERRWQRWKPWAIVGAGALTALIGLPLQLAARSNADRYEAELRTQCPEGCVRAELPTLLTDLRGRALWQSRLSVSLFAVGGVVLATGAALVYMNQPHFIKAENPKTPGLRRSPFVSPVAGRSTIGIVAGGTF